MTLNLDVVINTPDASVDMKSGLDTLQGVSDAIRCISETILTLKVPERQSHKADVRTTLKRSFSGSYGQIFSVDIHEQKALRKFNKIGKPTFLELISFFLNESVYKEHKDLSAAAQSVIDELGDLAEHLSAQLRKSPLHQLHEVAVKFDREIKIRYHKSMEDQTELASFGKATAESINAKLSKKIVKATVSVTRLNINTGNGRLVVKGEYDTVAFGFDSPYVKVPARSKRAISENLNYNNGRDNEAWQHLDIIARPLALPDGKVVKYIITEIPL
jgi:hypothetical protein